MGSRMYQLILLGIFIVLFMDEDIRNCYDCDYFDGYQCRGIMKACWKFNVLIQNRTCTTDHYYFNDRNTGRYLYRYTKLSCRSCEAGMFQAFHDLLRETFCCTDDDMCNDGRQNEDFGVFVDPDDAHISDS
ncbi:prostate and testis expressed protein 2 [Tenrec ecaudatus]|uniref:prostate and testis expressed protein 2 n=1 Tax=Tenrec ecaudatus TaxID=94439 RepID=UPI003F590EBB